MAAQVVGNAVGRGNPFEQLYRVLFWIAILLAAITLVQLVAVGLYMYARAKRPALLCFPRPQLFVSMLGIPALIQASARASCPTPLALCVLPELACKLQD